MSVTRPWPGNRSRPRFVVAPRVFRAPEAPAAVCASGRRPSCFMLLVAPLVFRAPSDPAAREIATREPAARSGRSRSPPVPSGSSGALHTGGACAAGVWSSALSRSPARPRRRSSILHVIPQQLVQTLNLHRWNCNVFVWSRKVTVGNYVRNLSGPGPAAAHRHRSHVLRRPPYQWGLAYVPDRKLCSG